MSQETSTIPQALGLKAGDWVQVRSSAEIESTLDARGTLEALPFMPEMLAFCGRRFQVYRTAHKTCDTIQTYTSRRMTNTVHLVGLRCDGAGHGGCQAACLLFWKEAWLKRVDGPGAAAPAPAPAPAPVALDALPEPIRRGILQPDSGEGADQRYACQTTELVRASAPLGSWEPGQFAQDLSSRNVRFGDFVRYMALAVWNEVARKLPRVNPWPHLRGAATEPAPVGTLGLKVGEMVQVRSKEEIQQTLDKAGKTRGLWFDVEMLPFCGRTFRVQSRVEKILDEKTGRMLKLPKDCVILENVWCSGFLSRDRMFCPRAIYPYWREAWLKRPE